MRASRQCSFKIQETTYCIAPNKSTGACFRKRPIFWWPPLRSNGSVGITNFYLIQFKIYFLFDQWRITKLRSLLCCLKRSIVLASDQYFWSEGEISYLLNQQMPHNKCNVPAHKLLLNLLMTINRFQFTSGNGIKKVKPKVVWSY